MSSTLKQMLTTTPEPQRVREGKSVSTRISLERYDTLMEATRQFDVKKSDLVAAVFDYGFLFLESKLKQARKDSESGQTA